MGRAARKARILSLIERSATLARWDAALREKARCHHTRLRNSGTRAWLIGGLDQKVRDLHQPREKKPTLLPPRDARPLWAAPLGTQVSLKRFAGISHLSGSLGRDPIGPASSSKKCTARNFFYPPGSTHCSGQLGRRVLSKSSLASLTPREVLDGVRLGRWVAGTCQKVPPFHPPRQKIRCYGGEARNTASPPEVP
jgi:hypothetical protein